MRLIAIWLVGLGLTAFGSESLENLANKLMEIRSEVEDLNSTLQSNKNEVGVELQSLVAEKGTLEASLKRAQSVKSKLDLRLKENSTLLKELSAQDENLLPVVSELHQVAEDHVKASLPFRQQERLGELKRIKKEIENKTLPPSQALRQLWSFLQDEVRLSRTNSLEKDRVILGDKEILADVVRLGMIALLFRTPGHEFGYVQREGSEWHYKLASGSHQESLVFLFDSFKKQIRTGYFQLPSEALQGLQRVAE